MKSYREDRFITAFGADSYQLADSFLEDFQLNIKFVFCFVHVFVRAVACVAFGCGIFSTLTKGIVRWQ